MSRIEQLLHDLGLETYLEAFREHAITDDVLPHLEMDDLKELGVGPLGHRRLILAAIVEAAGANSRSPQQNESEAERRHLTILFADLVGSTQLSQRLAAEDLRDLIRAYQDSSKTAIEMYEGYVAQFLGDGIVVYFGYPQSHEDDVERAIRAGLELITAVKDIDGSFGRAKGVDIAVRIGIETGPVIVGDIVGEGVSRERAVVGETPNFAARLQGLAEPDQIVLGPGAKQLLGGNAQLQSLGPQALKGFDLPVEVWAVEGLGFAGGRFERFRGQQLSRFIGRTDEVDTLETCFAAVKEGALGVVEIIGEAGIGKSRLVHEFLAARSSSTRVLNAHCASHGGSTAFFPFIDMFRRLLGIDDSMEAPPAHHALAERLFHAGLHREREIPYLLNLLGIGSGLTIDQDLIGIRTQAAIVSYIQHQSRILPTILFVNDLHWIDERSRNVLLALASDEGAKRLMLLGTYRDNYHMSWPSIAALRTIRLNNLGEAEASALFADRYGGEDSADGLDVFARTGGNPLFLEELAGHLRRTGAGQNSSTIPDTLAGLLLEQVDGQSSAARQLLRRAAVAGRRFSAEIVTEHTGSIAEQIFTDLLACGLIVHDGGANRYRFKHALVQDAIYEGLLTEDRQRLHREIGQRLEVVYSRRTTEFAEELSRHFSEAGDDLKAAHYAYLAGGKAFDLFALDDADYWFLRAIKLFPQEMGEADEKLRAQAISNHIQISCWDARFNDMIALADQEIARIEALGDTRELSRTLSWLGEGNLNCSNFAIAETLLSRALDIGERLKDLDSIGYALGEQGWLHTIILPGDPLEQLSAHARRLSNIADNLDDSYLATLAHYVEWTALIHGGFVDRARIIAERLIGVGEESGYPPALNWGHCMMSYCQVLEGNLDIAHEHAGAARKAAQCAFDNLMADLSLGIVCARSGDMAGSRQYLGRAQRLGDETGSLFFAYAAEAEFGRALLANGEVGEAIDWLDASRRHFTDIGHARASVLTGLALGEALIVQDGERAREVLTQTGVEAESLGMTGWRAAAALTLAGLDMPNKDRWLPEAQQAIPSLGWAVLARKADELAPSV